MTRKIATPCLYLGETAHRNVVIELQGGEITSFHPLQGEEAFTIWLPQAIKATLNESGKWVVSV